MSAARRVQVQRQLEDRIPEARRAVQVLLSRMTLEPRLSRAESNETRSGDAEYSRHALLPGTYAEVALWADELRMKGRLDVLTITGDRADITDHKTGLEDPAHLDQLRFYGALWMHDLVANPRRTTLRKLTLAYPNRDVSIDALDGSDLASFAESIKARVLEADRRIEVDVPAATTGPQCLRCPVRSVCTVYWTTVIPVPSSVAPDAWFDFEGIVGAQNGANSWWMLDLSGTRPVVLLRTASAQTSLSKGQRVRLLGIRRDADPDVEAVVATLTMGSEVFVVLDDRTD
ncbi:PD-(D/E)XK nuclease family protein [Salinibacterium hongtaonis]|uniref:PD-(D/E)XK nuclease family protein n=1 Tax=Homoserinimonas hongtaonis TaxID=2079791 RepID=UPI00131EE82E